MTGRDFRSAAFDGDAALRAIFEGTAAAAGDGFFAALVRCLADHLGTHSAWVTEYDEPRRRLRALAFRMRDEWVDRYEYGIDGTPCESVITTGEFVRHAENLGELFPENEAILREHGESYLGMALLAADGRVLGHLAVLDTRPMPPDPRSERFFRIFAARAQAELRCLENDRRLRVLEGEHARLQAEFDKLAPQNPGSRPPRATAIAGPFSRILTAAEFRDLERQNMISALRACAWKVSGKHGAAKLLGIHASTFASRMKSLGISRPGKG